MAHTPCFSRRGAFLETEQVQWEEEHGCADPPGRPGLSRARRAVTVGAMGGRAASWGAREAPVLWHGTTLRAGRVPISQGLCAGSRAWAQSRHEGPGCPRSLPRMLTRRVFSLRRQLS